MGGTERMRSIYGLGAALLIAQMTSPVALTYSTTEPPRKAARIRNSAPNDLGPVIDTAPESKRARRRRLARAAQEGNGNV